jgi:hypothetical protein
MQTELDRLTSAKVPIDGIARDSDGHALLFFADEASPFAFDGVRVEYISAAEQPVVRDNGLPLDS